MCISSFTSHHKRQELRTAVIPLKQMRKQERKEINSTKVTASINIRTWIQIQWVWSPKLHTPTPCIYLSTHFSPCLQATCNHRDIHLPIRWSNYPFTQPFTHLLIHLPLPPPGHHFPISPNIFLLTVHPSIQNPPIHPPPSPPRSVYQVLMHAPIQSYSHPCGHQNMSNTHPHPQFSRLLTAPFL